MAIETCFKNIADAIREKAGTSGLITPAQMPQAIADIPSGANNYSQIEARISKVSYGYIGNNGFFYSNPTRETSLSLYSIVANRKYLLFQPIGALDNMNRNRNRIQFYARNYSTFEYYINNSLSNQQIYENTDIIHNDTDAFDYATIFEYTPEENGTIIITTSNTGVYYPSVCLEEI